MSAQLRFRTLIKHAGGIYDAANEVRTDLLVGSLDDIVEKINPLDRGDWLKVEFDTRRLLKVWLSREQTDAAQILADQIMDSLTEFAATGASPSVTVGPLPHLEIVEKPVTTAPASVPVATLLTHSIEPDSHDDEDEEEDDDDELLVTDDEEEAVEDDDDEGASAPADVVVDVEEKKAPVPEPEPEPEPEADDNSSAPPVADHDEEGEVAEDDDGDSAAASEYDEVLEPEADAADAADAEEEEGMEVEKRTIRGRDYWLDVNSNKLYAVIDDDDVGDEVGAIVNGRPVFMAA